MSQNSSIGCAIEGSRRNSLSTVEASTKLRTGFINLLASVTFKSGVGAGARNVTGLCEKKRETKLIHRIKIRERTRERLYLTTIVASLVTRRTTSLSLFLILLLRIFLLGFRHLLLLCDDDEEMEILE